MVSLRLLGFVAAALLPLIRADTPPNPGKWFNPHDDKNATDYSVFHLGDRQNITYQVTWTSYTVMLWHEHPDGKGADRGPIVYTATGDNPNYFEWDVSLGTFNLTKSDIFLFWIFNGTDIASQGDRSIPDSSSPYFKIAEAVTTTTPSSTSTPTSAASTSSASTAASASSGGSLSAGASAGIGVGVALGVLAVAGIGGFLFWRKRRANKTGQQQQQQPSNGPWNEESKQYYTPVAGTPAYQDTSYHSASPPGHYNASQTTPVYEVAGSRDPAELGGN